MTSTNTTERMPASLTDEERAQFVALFHKATGVDLKEPEFNCPGAWIIQVWRATAIHVARMESLSRERPNRNAPDQTPAYCLYDPATSQLRDKP
jgi:hypothetical protein